MSEFKIGRVYKIIHNQSNIVYIGSTYNRLSDRWCHHKNHYKDYLRGKHAEIAIFPYFKEFGIENFKIILIKEYEVVDKKHLLMYEQLWINKLKSINKTKPFQPLKKERIKQSSKQHYQANKDKIRGKIKQYYDLNKDKIKEHHKEYYDLNKDKISEKFKCDCGSEIRKNHKSRHDKSIKHITYIKNLKHH